MTDDVRVKVKPLSGGAAEDVYGSSHSFFRPKTTTNPALKPPEPTPQGNSVAPLVLQVPDTANMSDAAPFPDTEGGVGGCVPCERPTPPTEQGQFPLLSAPPCAEEDNVGGTECVENNNGDIEGGSSVVNIGETPHVDASLMAPLPATASLPCVVESYNPRDNCCFVQESHCDNSEFLPHIARPQPCCKNQHIDPDHSHEHVQCGFS
jgi:hypothetical protein